MLNRDILASIPAPVEPLLNSQTVSEALQVMEKLALTQLPMVNAGNLFLGLIFEEDLLDDGADTLLSALDQPLRFLCVKEGEHFLNTARLQHQQQLELVPVVDDQNLYLGAVSPGDLLQQFCSMTAIDTGGAIIVVTLPMLEYSISQLARLVETNDAIIMQLNSSPDPKTGQLTLTIRLNKIEVSDVVSTLQRYDYSVVYHAGLEEYQNEMVRNYNNLMNYLDL